MIGSFLSVVARTDRRTDRHDQTQFGTAGARIVIIIINGDCYRYCASSLQCASRKMMLTLLSLFCVRRSSSTRI